MEVRQGWGLLDLAMKEGQRVEGGGENQQPYQCKKGKRVGRRGLTADKKSGLEAIER